MRLKPSPRSAGWFLRKLISSRVKRKKSDIVLSPESRPCHQISYEGFGVSLHCLSSRNSCPMKMSGIPGEVSSNPIANLLRLRAYQERELLPSESFAIRGERPL